MEEMIMKDIAAQQKYVLMEPPLVPPKWIKQGQNMKDAELNDVGHELPCSVDSIEDLSPAIC